MSDTAPNVEQFEVHQALVELYQHFMSKRYPHATQEEIAKVFALLFSL